MTDKNSRGMRIFRVKLHTFSMTIKEDELYMFTFWMLFKMYWSYDYAAVYVAMSSK